MQLLVDENLEIIAFAQTGILSGAIEYKGNVPDDFEENFKPSFYLLKNNEIVLNPNYIEPTPPKSAGGPTTEQQMINQLGLKYDELSAKVDKLKGGAVNG
ncbi:DUF2977 domain-containing protein [Latilactobacillus sakei]|nr:DUF2977 domain-containing protein [Latilactobacillus sakei]